MTGFLTFPGLAFTESLQSRDVIGLVTIRLSVGDFLYVLNRNQTPYLA